MAQDVFGRSAEGFGGAFDSSAAMMKIDEITDLLVANVSIQYSQSTNKVFDIQEDKTYFVIGRTQGQGTLGTIVGPKGAANAGVKKLGNVCEPKEILFDFTGASCQRGGGTTTATYKRRITDVILQSVGFSIQAENMLINENLGIQFGQLLDG